MLNSRITTLLSLVFIASLTGCSAIDSTAEKTPTNQYQYPHQCTKNGELVNHLITAKLPLSVEDLARLNTTLQESLQLDYKSCKFVGDLNVINKVSLIH